MHNYLKKSSHIYYRLRACQGIEKLVSFKKNASLVKKDGSTKKVDYMAFEFVPGGEIFEFVEEKSLEPEICRYYYR